MRVQNGLFRAGVLWLSAAVCPIGGAGRAAETGARPNVLYILADDLGWADVGFHGGEIKTPRLDKLAASGARLEQFYVQSVCSPTRAALLTGRYPMRLGLQVGVVRPWAQYGLPLEERTLPQALKEAGYATAIVGKWHLGHCRPEYLPTRRGFDHQYGHYNGAIDYFTHVRDGGLDWHRDDQALREDGYSTRLMAREAVRILARHDATKPLFLYVPFNAVHSPFQAPERYCRPYAGLKRPRRTYAGMVAALDEAVGQIVDQLEASGLRDNTLIIFHSDNGGPAPGVVTSNGPLRAGKATLYEGGVRVAAFAAWPGHIPAGSVVNAPLHVVDWYPTLLGLAGASLEQKLPLDGKNAWPALSADKPSPHEEILLNATPTAGALRVGDWKLVINGTREHNDGPDPATGRIAGFFGGDGRADAPGDVIELFNIARDPYERANLAASQPGQVERLRVRYDALARQAVRPKAAPPAPGYRPPQVWGEGGILSTLTGRETWNLVSAEARMIQDD
jgi:arylsulfatase A-like enzyme